MKPYSEEFKATIIAKMLPPHNVSVPELANQTGIPKDALYAWRIKNRKGRAITSSKNTSTEGLSSEDKFKILLFENDLIR